MCTKLKSKLFTLQLEEFEGMPASWCDNILPKKDPKKGGAVVEDNTWHKIFEDFLREDILIETCRFFKLSKILNLCKEISEKQFVTNKFKKEILTDGDYE